MVEKGIHKVGGNHSKGGIDELAKVVESHLQKDRAWIGYSENLETLQRKIPNLYILDGYFTFYASGFAVRKDWPYAEAVRKKFIEYSKNGYLYHVQQPYKKSSSQKSVRDSSLSLGIGEFSELLVIVSCVGFLSIVVTLLSSLRYFSANHVGNDNS